MERKKISSELQKRIITSVLHDAAEHGQPKYTKLAKQLSWYRQDGSEWNGPQVKRLIGKLRESYRWLDELLDFYGLGLRPEAYWTVLVLYAYLRHGTMRDAAREVGSTEAAVRKALERLDKTGGLCRVKALMWEAKQTAEIRAHYPEPKRSRDEQRKIQKQHQEIMARNRERLAWNNVKRF